MPTPGERMSVASPDELVELDRARNRPEPVNRAAFWVMVWGSPLVAAALLGLHAWAEPLSSLSTISGDTMIFVGLAVLLVVSGELLPVLGSRAKDPTGVAWSTPFAFAALLTVDAVPAVLLYAGATVFSGVVSRQAPHRVAFNAGQYALSVLAADAVLAVFGIQSSLADPWAPSGAVELLACLLAALAFFLVNELLVSMALGALTGDGLHSEFVGTLGFEVAVNGSQLLLGPLVAVVMVNAPLLTPLAVIPVAAIHISAAGARSSAWAATHDDLTGLANRSRFNETTTRLVGQLAGDRRSGTMLALFLLDLDRFKEVNDVLGHPTGDRVLQDVADRLSNALPDAYVVARLGGDEFAFLHSVSGPEHALALGEQVGAALREPHLHESGQLVDIDASIGVALAPDHGDDLEVLFSRADVAMYSAKRESRGTALFDPSAGSASISRLGILGSLRRALDDDELYLDFQPKVDLSTRALVGVEALVRWRHPSGVLVSPDEFIPAAEHSGLMPRLTERVLDLALQQAHEWRTGGLEVPVAVNVSLRDLLQPEFADRLSTMLRKYEVPAKHLTLEVTERVLASDLAQARNSMVRLHKLGVGLSMDDFGTGWSSLMMLRELPVTEVKLDRSFVSHALDSEMDLAIVAKVTELAHALGLTVVAEGVETMPVLNRLADLGCDQAQGWQVARPMGGDDVVSWSRAVADAELSVDGEVVPSWQSGLRTAKTARAHPDAAAGTDVEEAPGASLMAARRELDEHAEGVPLPRRTGG